MPYFSQHSKNQLATCHKDLQKVMVQGIKYFDFRVIEGFRSKERQNLMVQRGLSQVRWPFGKHNATKKDGTPESHAVDVAPWPIDWKKLHRFHYLAGQLVIIAQGMHESGEIKHLLRWGGDWDRDNIPVFDDPTEHFADLGHFELFHT